MKELHLLDSVERRLFFEVAASELKMPLEIIEKDYWVVWALGKLFSVPDVKNHLTFKGGTSLSKVFGIIHRFSEDIYLSIEKNFLGSEDPERATSGKKRRAILEKLSLACASYVQNELKDALEAAMAKSLGRPGTWQLSVDDDDPDKQTLQFQYPTTTPKGGYIRTSSQWHVLTAVQYSHL